MTDDKIQPGPNERAEQTKPDPSARARGNGRPVCRMRRPREANPWLRDESQLTARQLGQRPRPTGCLKYFEDRQDA